MKITIKSKIESTSLETVDIHIEFDPLNPRDEGLAAIVTTISDLVREYEQLSKLVNVPDQQ